MISIRKFSFLGAGILIIIGGGLFALFTYNKQTVPIQVAPSNATIYLDGKKIANNSRQWVRSGDHTIKISAEGYTTLEEKLSDQANQDDVVLYCLAAVSSAAIRHIQTDETDRSICEGYEGFKYNQLADQAYAKTPILNDLPFDEGLFSIGQGVSQKKPADSSTPALYVHYSTPNSLEGAKQWISKRANIADLEIIYTMDYVDIRILGGDGSEQYNLLEKNFPIVKGLPFKDPYFTLSYHSSDPSTVGLVIYTPSPRYRYAALQQIRAFGYDPTDYKVEFIDYKNPLGE